MKGEVTIDVMPLRGLSAAVFLVLAALLVLPKQAHSEDSSAMFHFEKQGFSLKLPRSIVVTGDGNQTEGVTFLWLQFKLSALTSYAAPDYIFTSKDDDNVEVTLSILANTRQFTGEKFLNVLSQKCSPPIRYQVVGFQRCIRGNDYDDSAELNVEYRPSEPVFFYTCARGTIIPHLMCGDDKPFMGLLTKMRVDKRFAGRFRQIRMLVDTMLVKSAVLDSIRITPNTSNSDNHGVTR